ncbi:unnamed protein product [Caenorhabditis bovis]|uniref:SXP/RAL-2 family protein Ani s 5-like cation-binding domain-containing protein n=1 Tax=Caenorhabditis bovis TaxID=2654633 RepID=A0A8S1ETA6_9PELO|nr:unnamed protein product [Caenorhabditis bovis]
MRRQLLVLLLGFAIIDAALIPPIDATTKKPLKTTPTSDELTTATPPSIAGVVDVKTTTPAEKSAAVKSISSPVSTLARIAMFKLLLIGALATTLIDANRGMSKPGEPLATGLIPMLTDATNVPLDEKSIEVPLYDEADFKNVVASAHEIADNRNHPERIAGLGEHVDTPADQIAEILGTVAATTANAMLSAANDTDIEAAIV